MNTALTPSHPVGSFFELALRRGYEEGKITREKVNHILSQAPKGIVQIASKFERPYLQSGLKRAMNRMVALVSLYLESASDGDLDRAIALIQSKTVLELSRGGSDMVKAMQ